VLACAIYWRPSDVLDGSDIENAVAKSAERYRGVADVGFVGKHHLQDTNITNDGRGDGGDEKEDSRDKEKEGTEVVEDSCFMHRDGSGLFKPILRVLGGGVCWLCCFVTSKEIVTKEQQTLDMNCRVKGTVRGRNTWKCARGRLYSLSFSHCVVAWCERWCVC